jgi:alpha 1,3-glucosidase
MYNLDVFEYEIDEPMALYGHVPMMIGHSEKYTSGIYWHNSAETWIDVQRNSDSVFHFLSSSVFIIFHSF